jgi:molecular chaperone GrpE
MMTSSTPSSTVPDVDQSRPEAVPRPDPERAAASDSRAGMNDARAAEGHPDAGADAAEEVRNGAASERSDASDAMTTAEAQDRWRRTAAELDNTRKRAAREVGQARERERAAVAGQFLPVLDNLELALVHADADPASIIDGIRAVRDQAIAVLARLGYERRDQSGVPFDPAAHEVVTVVDDPDAAPGTVVRVLRPGYGDSERQLRPVGVAVARRQE